MFPGSIELTQRLAEVAPERVEMYLAALRFHFALWRWQRISEPQSLGFLRRTLLEVGLVEVSPDAGWIVNRDSAMYMETLGGLGDSYIKLSRDALGGHVSSRYPGRSIDSGSGNNTAAYEMTRGSTLVSGVGLGLVFPLDVTLRNFLYEPFRSHRLPGYKSEAAGSALKGAEIWTINRFGMDLPSENDFNPIVTLERPLSSGSIKGSACSSASKRTREFLDNNRPSKVPGRALAISVGLGYLIDAIASRARFPNGMDFTYADIAPAAQMFPVLSKLLQEPANQTASTKLLPQYQDQLEDLSSRITKHLEDPSLSPEDDLKLTEFLSDLADLFKAIGFELRQKNSDVQLINTFHFVGNELWRWHFFLDDWPSWNSTSDGWRMATHNTAMVRRWLERPWGVMRFDEMNCALAEGFAEAAKEESPPLLNGLLSLLKGGVDGLIKAEFARVPNIQKRIDWLIEQRCRLRDLRESIKFVTYEDEDDDLATYRDLADLLIELLTIWFYDQSEQKRQEIIKDEFRPLQNVMRSARWLEETRTSNHVPLTRGQMKLLEQYQANPNQVIDLLFDFKNRQGLFERVDVFPLEEFWIWNAP